MLTVLLVDTTSAIAIPSRPGNSNSQTWHLKPIERPSRGSWLGWVAMWHWLSLDKVAEADLNCMVTERSDSEFVGLVNSWTGRFVCGFVKSRNAVLISHYINF